MLLAQTITSKAVAMVGPLSHRARPERLTWAYLRRRILFIILLRSLFIYPLTFAPLPYSDLVLGFGRSRHDWRSEMAVPFLLLLIASSLLQISASDPLFYESSDEPFEGWWIESEKDDYQVPDPDDKKPENWDERVKIPDSDAVKPDDWDEDASMEIEDEEAVKPERWVDDEPEEVNDSEATKPEDWDDEDDGEWEAPKIDNPKCEAAPGCGEWKRPTTRNSGYKGK
ncbi:hypothetical protein B296_00058776 [Ensete ventricosum]|uniref:Calnexin n=1 Tax=Ensete ventricosum TaxID=4639 RepID=A0A426XKK5_ENSVE|nr:hypothetical protein B296_00058776 [Ensete ventricosum]